MSYKDDLDKEFRRLASDIVATANDHPGDGLRALNVALKLVLFDRDTYRA